jgi:hypothetical protein
MKALDRYNFILRQLPPPGCGCHASLLSVSNLGVRAGLDAEQIFRDLREHIPKGNRHVPDKEIRDAVNKALADHDTGTFIPRPQTKPVVNDPEAARQRIIDQGKYSTEAELISSSPVAIYEEPGRSTRQLIEMLYGHDDHIFIGERHQAGVHDETIRSADDWLVYFSEGGKTAPFIIINPLTGLPAEKKSGDGTTYRGDLNVKEYRYCLGEFDNLSLEEQILFWTGVKLPIVALTSSAGKSIHALLDVQGLAEIKTAEQWLTEIKQHLYDRILMPLGVDTACSNPARLSRLPGHYREEKGQYQKLLWLSPRGVSL